VRRGAAGVMWNALIARNLSAPLSKETSMNMLGVGAPWGAGTAGDGVAAAAPPVPRSPTRGGGAVQPGAA